MYATNKEDRTSAKHGKRYWLWYAIFLLFLFVYFGGRAPMVNEVHYLAKAKHYWDPDWCGRDLFLQSRDVHNGFYLCFGWLTNVATIPIAAGIIRWCSWWMVIAAWIRLSRSLGLTHLDGFLAFVTAIVLVDNCNFAGEWLVGGAEGKPFAYAFVLWGLAMLVDRRWGTSCLATGLATFLHPVVGGWAFLGCFAVMALYFFGPRSLACTKGTQHADGPRPRPSFIPQREIIPAILGCLLVAAGVWPILIASRSDDPSVRKEATVVHVYQRLPHHLVASQIPMFKHIRFGVLAGGWCVLAWLGRRHSGLCILNTFALVSLIIMGIGAGIDDLLVNDRTTAAGWLRFYWFRLGDAMIPLMVAISTWLLLTADATNGIAMHQDAGTNKVSHIADITRLVGLAAFACLILIRFQDHWQDPRPPADRQGSFGLGGSQEDVVHRYEDWRDLCTWVGDHTSENALILTPTRSQTFKWYAERAEYVTWKDCPQDPPSLLAWQQRIEHINKLSLYRRGDGPPTNDIESEIMGTDVDYVVTLRELMDLNGTFPLVYRNGTFACYRVTRDR